MLTRIAELIDRNGQRIAREWREALEQSGNRVLSTLPEERVWQLALNWVALLLEGMRADDLAPHQRGFDLTAKRLILEGLLPSDTIELISVFKRILWRVLEDDGARYGLQAGRVMRELEPYFDGLCRQLVREHEQAWQAAHPPEAAQASVVQHAQVLSREAEEQAIIARLTQGITTERELPRLLASVLTAAAQLVGARKGGLTLFDRRHRMLRYQAHYHLPRSGSGTGMPMGEGLSGLAAASGQAQTAENLQEHLEASVRAQAKRLGTHSGVSIPLMHEGGAIGTLDLFDQLASEHWTERDLRLLQDISGRAARAIANLQSWQESDERASRRHLVDLADLTWVSEKIGSTLDRDTILGTVVQAVMKALNVPIAAVMLPTAEGVLTIPDHGQQGLDDTAARALRLLPDDSRFADALGGQPQVVEALSPELVEGFPLAGVQAFVCVPLSVPDQPAGLVLAADRAPRSFELHQVALLLAYANQSALALHNAQLYADAINHLEQLSTVSEVTKDLTSTLDLHERLERLLQSARRLLRATAGTIWLLDEEKGELSVVTEQGLGEGRHFPTKLKLGEGTHGTVAARGEAMAVRDLVKDGRFKARAHARERGLRSLLAAPLVSKGKVVGVIAVYTGDARDFSQAEITLLSTLGNEAGISIENAQLYEQSRERAAFLTTLMEEVDHRVKSNLQIVAGLMELQLTRGGHTQVEDVLRDSINRIRSIAVVHEMLSQGDVKLVDMKETARRILEITRQTSTHPDQHIAFRLSGARVMLPSKPATSLALVINEAVVNALEHAFQGRKRGAISVSLQEAADHILVQVHDDGRGLPEGFEPVRDGNLGMQIIHGLVTQDLRGELTLTGNDGTTLRVRLPK